MASVPAASQTLSAAEEPTSDPGDRDHDEVDHRKEGEGEQEETFLPVPILNDAGFAVTQAWVQEMHPGLGYEAAARMAAGRAVLRVSYTSDDHSAWTILTDGLPIQGEGDQEGGNKCLSYLRQEQGLQGGLPKRGAEIGPVAFDQGAKTRCLEWLPLPANAAPVANVYQLQVRHTSKQREFLCLEAQGNAEAGYRMQLAQCEEVGENDGGKGEQEVVKGGGAQEEGAWHPQWWLWKFSPIKGGGEQSS